MADSLGEVFLFKTTNRATGIPKLINRFNLKERIEQVLKAQVAMH